MNLVLRAVAAAVAAVALTPAVALAQQQYAVDFGWTPTSPTTAETATLRAATTTSDVVWDFDGDGHPDASGSVVEHRFATAGDHRVTVTASWPGAVPIKRTATKTITVQATGAQTPAATPTPTSTATPEPAATPVATPAPCPKTVTAGPLTATAACFATSPVPNATRYRSATTVRLNGMELVPAPGKFVDVDVPRPGGTLHVRSAGAKVFLKPGQLVHNGAFDWKVTDGNLGGFAVNAIGAMKVTKVTQAKLLPTGQTQLGVYFALPPKLGGATSTAPVTVRSGAGAPPIVFKVQHGWLPGLSLSELTVRSDGADSWGVDAKVQLPQPIGLKVSGGLSVKNGNFAQLYSNTSLGSKHGPVHLKRLSFAVEADPAKSKCRAAGAQMAMCGDLALTAGPSLLGAPALSLEGGFGFNLFESKPSVLKAYGKVKLVGMTLKDAEFEMRDTGYVGVKSKLQLGWPGVATIKGSSKIEFQGTKFNGESKDQVCLEFIDYCLGAETLLSTKGIAACLTVDVWLGSWHPGFGAKWGQTPTLYWKGCDLAPYREAFASAASTTKRVHFGRGLPGAVIAVKGAGGAPRVAFVGPKGERIETPVDGKPVGGKGYFLMKVPGENLTQVAIAKPSAGTWKVVPIEGTITSVKSAEGLDKPSVSATVRGGKLHYRVKPMAGQVVRFTVAGREIGRAKGKRGTLRLPMSGDVVALVEQNGALRDRSRVARYTAPTTVSGVNTRATESGLTVSWRGPRAVEVTVSTADGRRIVLRPDANRVTLPGITQAKVKVRPLR